MGETKTALETLLIMAYNVGRDHGERGSMPIEQGREVVLAILNLVEGIDPGDLAKPWPAR